MTYEQGYFMLLLLLQTSKTIYRAAKLANQRWGDGYVTVDLPRYIVSAGDPLPRKTQTRIDMVEHQIRKMCRYAQFPHEANYELDGFTVSVALPGEYCVDVTLSPCRPVNLSHCHPITLSPCRPPWPALRYLIVF